MRLKLRTAHGWVVLVALLPWIGCFQPPSMVPEQLERGYVLILPGVESTTWSMKGIYEGLREAGVDRAIDLDPWGKRPFGTFRNLPAYELNRRKAAFIAAKLAAYHREYPGRPIDVIGYSGGGGMALFAAEVLPEGVTLERIILLGGAVSPGYDIRPALARCREGIINFYSANDWFMGGWATVTFGTMDRKNTSTAGHVGFQDADGHLLQTPGLEQIPWTPAWRKLGHDGGHAGWRAKAWAREILTTRLD